MAIFIRSNVEFTDPAPNTPVVPATPFTSDTFNRSAGALGSSTDAKLGGKRVPWTGPTEALKIEGNRATVTGAVGAYFVAVTAPSPNIEAAVTVAAKPAGNVAAYLDIRRPATGDCIRLVIGANTVNLAKRVSGAMTDISSLLPYVAGDRVAIRAKGTQVVLLLNGNTVATATVSDSQLQYTGSAGISGVSTLTGVAFDDFTLTELT